MRIAMEDLKLSSMVVVCPRSKPYELAKGIKVRSLDCLIQGMDIFG